MEKQVLYTGLTVIYDYIENSNSVSMGYFVNTGSNFETEEEAGISHLLEHMMFKGTSKYTASEISNEFDYLGANINAYTTKEITVYYVSAIKKYSNKILELLSDIVVNSTFPEEELVKEKGVVIEEIKMYEDSPDSLVHDLNSQDCMSSPFSKPIIGTEESVQNISRDMLVNYYKERYTCDNIVLVISGNFKKEELEKDILKYTKNMEKHLTKRVVNEKFEFNEGYKEYKKQINQINICVSYDGISYLNKNKIEYDLLSNIIGGTMSSRFFQKIREDLGLAYSVYTYINSYREGGVITTYVGTNKKNYEKVIDIVKNEFKEISKGNFTEQELEKAKNQILSKLVFSVDSSRQKMGILGNYYLKYGEIFNYDDYIKSIEKIKLKDFNNLFKNKFLNSNVTVLGDI